MKIISIDARNFLSYDTITYSSFDNGLTLISGYNCDQNTANGVGKSSIMDLIVYTLFGKTPRNTKVDELIKHGQSQMECLIHICVPNKKSGLVIKRTRNPNTLSAAINGHLIKSQDSNDLQEKINAYLEMDYKLFLNSVYFAQFNSGTFLSSNDEEKKDILLDICNMNIFDELYELVSSKIKKSNQELVVLSNSLQLNESSRQSLDKKTLDLQTAESNFESNKEKDLEFIDKELTTISEEVNLLKKKLEDCQYDADGYNVRHARYIKAIEMSDSLKKCILEQGKLFSQFNTSVEKIKDIRDKLKVAFTNICPTCKQNLPVGDVLVSNYKTNLKNETENARLLKEKLNRVESFVSVNKNLIEKELEDAKIDLEQYSGLKKASDDIKKQLDKLRDRSKELGDRAININERKNDYDDILMTTKLELKTLKDKINEDIKNKECLDVEMVYLGLTKDVFGPHGVRSMILDLIINQLNERINHYLKKLFDSPPTVIFSIDQTETKTAIKSKINTVIVDANNNQVNFNSLSGGEKRRIIIASDFALADIVGGTGNNRFDLMLLDEITDGLDAVGRDKLYSMLEELSTNRAVFIVDHAIEMKDRFSKIIEIKKQGGTSCLV